MTAEGKQGNEQLWGEESVKVFMCCCRHKKGIQSITSSLCEKTHKWQRARRASDKQGDAMGACENCNDCGRGIKSNFENWKQFSNHSAAGELT